MSPAQSHAHALPLSQQCCTHQSGPALSADEEQILLSQLQGWHVDAGKLSKTFTMADFHGTMAFVNAVAWIAHAQDHHPDLAVSYKHCTIEWSTHSVNGLSINDFICAARVDGLSA
ncbi:MAG: 4a-hydroxytetrahydrobiopterin dehydratase [Aquabacterium sp.]|nr:4a-hydroxytetrahydrobiopterin dehydratase [Aquabacterium sp.]